MNVLSIDTSTEVGTVAVVCGGHPRAEKAAEGRARHGEQLLAHIEWTLSAAGLGLGELDLLAVGIGPGSFTGLRVGLATIKGLALASGLPVVGVSSLRVLARGLGLGGEVVVAPVADAHRDEVFAAAFARSGPAALDERLGAFHAPPEQAAARLREAAGSAPLLVCGGGLRKHLDRMRPHLGDGVGIAPPVWDAPRAALLALEAVAAFEREGPADLVTLEPHYLRPSDAKLPD
ncbi:MAG: tRNA (adenosine(37)-N6)-threonylcarbamoyltransferase complex dimerization subunit type 1 TsaB [Myxococcota bacterium]